MTPQPVMHPTTSPTGRRKRRQRTSLYLSAVVITLGLLAAVGGFWWAGRTPTTAQAEPATNEPFSLRGYATLRLPNFTWTAGPPELCFGMGPYRDIRPDTPVIVTDQSGSTIATGVLGFGEPVRSTTDTSKATACKLPLHVSNIPADRPFYKIAIGDRKAVDYNKYEVHNELSIAID